jgi:hypothetical protein
MGTIPASGSEITMGKVAKAFGFVGTYPPAAGANIRLNADLGVNYAGKSASTETHLSEDFGGLTSPNDYP